MIQTQVIYKLTEKIANVKLNTEMIKTILDSSTKVMPLGAKSKGITIQKHWEFRQLVNKFLFLQQRNQSLVRFNIYSF